MVKGFIISESLKDPTFLNELKQLSVKVKAHPEHPETPVWHLFKIEAPAQAVTVLAGRLAAELKPGWYAHFWSDELLYISFPGRVFRLNRSQDQSSPAYREVVQYGRTHGIEERYLNFLIEE
jgi:hypothetical protein